MNNKEAASTANAKGNAAFSAKNFGEAVKHYTEAIGHDPSSYIFYSNRSACYALSMPPNYADSLQDAKKCVSLKPDFAAGYSRKGLAESEFSQILAGIAPKSCCSAEEFLVELLSPEFRILLE